MNLPGSSIAGSSGFISRAIAMYVRLIELLGAFLIAALAIIGVIAVFYRYVMNDSLAWSGELMRFVMIWCGFLLAGLSYTRGEMLGFTLLIGMLPPRARWWALLVGRLAMIGFLLIAIWYDVIFVDQTQGDLSTALQLPMGWMHASVGVGSVILILHIIAAQLAPTTNVTPPEGTF